MPRKKCAKVRTWNADRGFGFLQDEHHGDQFIHITQVHGGKIQEGDWVQYATRPSRRKPGKLEAVKVVPFSTADVKQLSAIVRDSLTESSTGDVLPSYGIEALLMLPEKDQIDAVSGIVRDVTRSSWAALHQQFRRGGFRMSLASSVLLAEIKAHDSFLNSKVHVQLWAEGEDVQMPSQAMLVSMLTDLHLNIDLATNSFSRFDNGLLERFKIMKLIPSPAFEVVMEEVGAFRLELDRITWVKELDSFSRELIDGDQRKNYCEQTCDGICTHVLSDLERVMVALEDQVISPDWQEFVAVWRELTPQLKSRFFQLDSFKDGVDCDVLVGLLERDGPTTELIADWEYRIKQSDLVQELFENQVKGDSADLLLDFWGRGLIVDLPLRSFLVALGESAANQLDVLKRNVARLEYRKWFAPIQERLDKLKVVDTPEQLAYIEECIELVRELSGFSVSANVPYHPAIADRDKIANWARTENVDWVGVDLYRRAAPFLSVKLHVAVARKFFLHVRNGQVQAKGGEFFDFVEVGCSDAVPFAERVTWKVIRKLARYGKWPVFEEVLSEYSRNRRGWPVRDGDFWPLFDECSGRTVLKFPRKLEDSDWLSLPHVDVLNEKGIFINSRYQDNQTIRTIPGTRWVKDEKRWRTDHSNRDEAIRVARSLGYYIKDSGSFWFNNNHLIQFKTSDERIKTGSHCLRCEGRKSLKADLGYDFRWCRNEKCFATTLQMRNNWESATLRDFLETLSVDMSERDRNGEVVELAAYSRFMGGINRFISLYERLECGWRSGSSCTEKVWLVPVQRVDAGFVFQACSPPDFSQAKNVFLSKRKADEFGIQLEELMTWERAKELGVPYRQFRLETRIDLSGFEFKPLVLSNGEPWRNSREEPWFGMYRREGGKGCSKLLTPHVESKFAHYRLTHFTCSNEACDKHREEIYLHHCLQCGLDSVIDSRESAKCPNGWYICKRCYACCSDMAVNKRSKNLKTVGMLESSSRIEGYGHMEKNEWYCHCCGTQMEPEELTDKRSWRRDEFSRKYRCQWCRTEVQLKSNGTNKFGFGRDQ